MKNTSLKGRNEVTYRHKTNRMRSWYNKLEKNRKDNPNPINKNIKQPVKRAELKPLQFYLDQIKKPNQNK